MNRMVLIMVRVVALILTIALWCWLLGCTLSFVSSRLSGATPLDPGSASRRASRSRERRPGIPSRLSQGRRCSAGGDH